jgi:hypothetical protein
MPLCPQITNTPITVTLTADFTVTNVVPVLPANTEQLAALDAEVAAADAAAAAAVATANAAAATAGAAQSTANTALANAATAYSAAIGSLQPSASTIVNASNQMTAIAANGITVYSGSSASSGARVVLNSTGLAGFNSGGTATFSISASTGAAVFSGSVTGATITASTMNIGGNAIIDASGLLTATGATITGAINATSGYFGTVANGFSISSTGLVGVGAGTIVGGAISGTTFTNGSTFSVTSAGVLTATSGTIGGFTLSASSIYSSTNLVIQTSGTITGGNSSTIFYGFANIGGGAVTGERLIVAGTSALNGNTGVLGNLSVTNSATFGAVTQQFEYLSSTGNVRVASTYGNAVSGRSMQISSSGLYGTTASTRRKKHEIESYSIDSAALLNLDIKTFKYNPDIDEAQSVQYGFIAEEAQELGLDELIQYDSTGVPDYFAYEKLPIFLLQLIKELKAEIDILKGE